MKLGTILVLVIVEHNLTSITGVKSRLLIYSHLHTNIKCTLGFVHKQFEFNLICSPPSLESGFAVPHDRVRL